MSNSKLEAVYVKWLSDRLDPEDKEQLAAFRAWLERGADDPDRCVTVQEVVAAWQRLIEERKMH